MKIIGMISVWLSIVVLGIVILAGCYLILQGHVWAGIIISIGALLIFPTVEQKQIIREEKDDLLE